MVVFSPNFRVLIQNEKKGGNRLNNRKSKKSALKPGELEQKCDAYLSQCDELLRRATWQGLAGYVGVTSRTLSNWLREEGTVADVLRKAADAISDRLQQRTDSMAVLSVKQPLYGGFLDRTQGAGSEHAVRIQVTVGAQDDPQAAEFGK